VTPTTAVPPEVAEYLAAVRAALDDLPATERDDLLAEVEPSLLDAAFEAGGNVSARLGPAEEFAAELRTAAGLQVPPRRTHEGPLLLVAARRLARDPRVQELRRLAPIWWIVRAYLLVAAIALAAGASWSLRYFLVPHLGSAWLGLLAIAAAAALSIWIGLRDAAGDAPRRARERRPARPGDPGALALPASPAAGKGRDGDGVRADAGPDLQRRFRRQHLPLQPPGSPPPHVLLYTGAGTPLDAPGLAVDPQRRVLRSKSGKEILNAYPVRYFDPGTGEVAHPGAAPHVRIPEIATPPLPVAK
jgi:hypothetical protein